MSAGARILFTDAVGEQSGPSPVDAAEGRLSALGPLGRRLDAFVRTASTTRWADPRLAVSLAAAGLALGMVLGASSPNAQTFDVRLPLSVLPPLGGGVVLASVTLYVAEILAGLGLAGMLWANSRGWRPDARRLVLASAVVVAIFACLTPVGSADVASYAAYGRIAAQGGNPYVTTPQEWGEPAYLDPVGTMWKTQPSVYGPIATLAQAAAASIGGSDVTVTILAWMLLNGAAFLGVGLLLLRTSDDPVRATLFWTANPVLILALVCGGHLDTLVAAAAVGAVHVARTVKGARGDLLAGVIIGLGAGVKISVALIGVGLVLPLLLRRDWGRIARMTAAALATLTVQYSFWGVSALDPILHGLHLMNLTSPWRIVLAVGEFLGGDSAELSRVISLGWVVVLLVLAWFVNRHIAADQPREVVIPFSLVFAWLFAAPWVFAWYTAMAWALLSLIPRNRMTKWLTAVTIVLALFGSSGGHLAHQR